MVATVGSVQALFRADMRQYTAELIKGEKATRKTVTGIQRDVERLKRVGELAATFGKSLFAGLVAGATVRQLTDVAKSIATIGDEAKRAGVSARVFQEWRYVAEQNRIGVDSLVDGFKELSLRADEFIVTGAGPAAEAFARLGLSAEDLKTKLADPSALMLEMIDRLGKFDRAAQIRLADEVFGGTGGERFVELISQGADGIRATIDEANRLGIVLDDQVIARAAELDQAFNKVANTVGSALKSAIVSAATSLQDFISAFNGFDAQRDVALQEQLAGLGRERLDVEREIMALRDRQRSGGGAGDGIFGTSIGESTIGEAMADHERRMEAIAAEEAAILGVLEARRQARETPSVGGSTWTPPNYVAPNADRDRAAKSAAREAQAVRDLIAQLERELALVGATALEAEIANNVREAGAAATEEQRRTIVALTTALHQETAAHEAAVEAATYFASTMSDAFMSIVPAIETGNDALDNLLNSLVQAVAQAALLGQGPLAGLFGTAAGGAGAGGLLGSLFGAVLHQGGDAASARTFRPIASLPRFHSGKSGVGHNELLAVLERSETVLTAQQTGRMVNALGAAGASLQDGGGVRVVVGIEDTGGLNIMPTVRAVSQEEAAKSSARVAQAVPGIAAGSMEEGRSRRIRPRSF